MAPPRMQARRTATPARRASTVEPLADAPQAEEALSAAGPGTLTPGLLRRADLPALQRRLGNRAVEGLLARTSSPAGAQTIARRPSPALPTRGGTLLLQRCPGCGGKSEDGGQGECAECRARRLARSTTAPAEREPLQRMPVVIQRISYDGCEVREWDVRNAHDQAKRQMRATVTRLRAYNGSQAAVGDALERHFHSRSQIVAFAAANHMSSVLLFVDWAQYECHEDETNGSALASTVWCVPFTDIRLWKPWFSKDIGEQANTLVHEWMHKYDCAFDLGYDFEEEYHNSGTVRALLNAEPYGNIVQALGG